MAFNLRVFTAVFCVAVGVVLAAPPPPGEKDEAHMPMLEPKCAGTEFKDPKWDNATIKGVEECHMMMKPMPMMNGTMNMNSTSNGTNSNSTNSSQNQNMKPQNMKDNFCQATICSGQKLGVLDAKGMPVKANITSQLQTIVPSNKLSDVTTAINGCLDKHANKLDMTKCNTYEELFDCVHKGVGKVCQWPEPKDSKEKD